MATAGGKTGNRAKERSGSQAVRQSVNQSGNQSVSRTDSQAGVQTDNRISGHTMERIMKSRWYSVCIRYICPALLFLAPFWKVNQGVDFVDTGYNLGNYANYASLGTTWKLATYLSNELARFFRMLPGGETVLFMNLYTTLLVSIMAVAAWHFCKSFVHPLCAFAGELLAICLCWCPTVILYHYFTYFILLFAVIALLRGIVREDAKYYVASGLLLGMNVFVRFSNLTETALILLVWYGCYVRYHKDAGRLIMKAAGQTGWCLLGFLLGFGAVFAAVCSRFGLSGYLQMLFGMQSIEGSASGYSVWDMLLGPWREYWQALRWLLPAALYTLAGGVLFRAAGKRYIRLKQLVYLAGLPLLYRYYWGQGMFDTNYYSYGAIFWPSVLLIMLGIAVCAVRIGKERLPFKERLLTGAVFLIIWLTPLGSNNRNYTLINNLFLVLPFILAWTWRLCAGKGSRTEALPAGAGPERRQDGDRKYSGTGFPVKAQLAVFLLFFAVQAAGFGALFVFGDGSYAEKRNTKVENSAILRGIYTTQAKADTIEVLTGYYEGLGGNVPVLTYGRLPGLIYYLGAPQAIGSSWPDLESYSPQEYRADMERLKEQGVHPLVLLNAALDEEDRGQEKYKLLARFLEENGYRRQLEINGVVAYY